jgi:hypothetical protein
MKRLKLRAMKIQERQNVTRKNGSLDGLRDGSTRVDLLEPSLSKSKRSTATGDQDPLFLFACHVEWDHQRNPRAYQALVAALDNSDNRIREIVELLLHRILPRPQRESPGVYRK